MGYLNSSLDEKEIRRRKMGITWPLILEQREILFF